VALWACFPALILVVVALSFEPGMVAKAMSRRLPAAVQAMDEGQRALWLADALRIARSSTTNDPARQDADVLAAARQVATMHQNATLAVLTASVGVAWVSALFARRRIVPGFPARAAVERVVRGTMACAAGLAVFTTFGIVVSLIAETARFFERVSFADFLLGLRWSPQTALRVDQVAASGSFGAIPLFVGTLLITGIAMCVAVPLGLLSAVFTSEYASARARSVVKPLLEVLAGVPTVVYGFFAALTVAPALRALGVRLGIDVASESALAAGAVMGLMIVPFVSSLSDDVMNAVPQSLRDGAYALGATKSETIRQIVLPAALPGIAGAVLLAMSRAIGETMIVVMAAGLTANLTVNPLAAVTTVTVQIVTLLVGDQEFDSAKTLAAFALGLVLFVVTLTLNVAALVIVRRYREQYE
jgi:phosphate transport system permease protein